MDYPRRRFLGQCAAMPLAVGVAVAADPFSPPTGVAPSIVPLARPDEAQLAKDVESLIDLLPANLRYRRVPVPAEKNAWPIWEEAAKAYIEQPDDEEFQEGEDRYYQGDPTLPDSIKVRFAEWAAQNEECGRLIDDGIKQGAFELPRSAACSSIVVDDGRDDDLAQTSSRKKGPILSLPDQERHRRLHCGGKIDPANGRDSASSRVHVR